MEYSVKTIQTGDALRQCPSFEVNNYQWTCKRRPETWGRMGYLPGRGLLVRMFSKETDPLRTMRRAGDMVCKDSAMEAFFHFPDDARALREGFAPGNDGLYFNFEVNANGAMYAKYGHGRQNRHFISDEDYHTTAVRAGVEEGGWWMEFCFPLSLLARVAGIETLRAGDAFYCNFYKISEDPAIEHYASYSPIGQDTPNFHLPVFFARAVIED